MEFKKLDLVGFKSFVDKTSFFIEKGLTGIVGPNGCGKSNIVESIRWCMGETSAKSMRGSGMEDIIFSGTANKTSKNIAEVNLTLDNSDKEGPSQYRELDIINVKRRIEKDKGSKYYIFHTSATHTFCRSFTHAPSNSFNNIRFTTAIGTHYSC